MPTFAPSRKLVLVLLALTALCGLAPARAADPPPAATTSSEPGGVRAHLTAETPLSDAPGKKLSMVHVEFAPGGAMKPHAHGGTVLVYVVGGAIRSQVAGGTLRVYHAGESWVEQPGVRHLVCGNASTTEPAELVATLLADVAPAGAPGAGGAGGDAAPDTLAPSGRHHD